MGTTFCNTHIYNPDKVTYELKSDYCCVNITEGWDTILETKRNYKFKAMAKIAKDLSFQLKGPAICVNYFDDDVFDMSLYLDGVKKAYYHVADNNVLKKNISEIIKALQLDDKTAKAFRYLVTKEIHAPEAVDRVSALFGLPLYMDKQMYDEMNGEVAIPDRAATINELDTEKKLEKVSLGNKKEISVIQEIQGSPYCYVDIYNGIITLLQSDSEGVVNPGHCTSYQLIQGEQPYFVADHDIDFDLDSLTDLKNKKGFYYSNSRLFGEGFYIYSDEHKYCIAQGEEDCKLYKEKILISANNKKPLEKDIYKVGDQLNICTSKGKARFESDGPLYLKKDGNYNRIEYVDKKFLPNNSSLIADRIQYFEHVTRRLYAEDGVILRIGEQIDLNDKNRQRYVRVDFYDMDMNLRDTELVAVDFRFFEIFGNYCYIKEKRQIVVGGYLVDLNKKMVAPIATLHLKLKEKMSSCIRVSGTEGAEYIAIISQKTVYFLDMNLNPVYYADVKGNIMGYWFDGKGNMFMITTKYPYDELSKYKNDSVVRILKLEI